MSGFSTICKNVMKAMQNSPLTSVNDEDELPLGAIKLEATAAPIAPFLGFTDADFLDDEGAPSTLLLPALRLLLAPASSG